MHVKKNVLCIVATELLCKKDPSVCLLVEQMVWQVTKVRSNEWSPNTSSWAWIETATVQQGWPRAKSTPARETGSHWELPQTHGWETSPNKSQPLISTTGLPWHHMVSNIALPQHRGLSSGSCMLHSCDLVAVLSLVSLVYDLAWNSLQCNPV